MPVTDPIADLLTRLRNSVMVRQPSVRVPASNPKLEIVRVLKDEGFIKDYQVLRDSPQGTIQVQLLYRDRRQAAINGLKRVSKPGLRLYMQKGEVPLSYRGLGISIITTPQGIMTGREARRKGLGGELLCYVW